MCGQGNRRENLSFRAISPKGVSHRRNCQRRRKRPVTRPLVLPKPAHRTGTSPIADLDPQGIDYRGHSQLSVVRCPLCVVASTGSRRWSGGRPTDNGQLTTDQAGFNGAVTLSRGRLPEKNPETRSGPNGICLVPPGSPRCRLPVTMGTGDSPRPRNRWSLLRVTKSFEDVHRELSRSKLAPDRVALQVRETLAEVRLLPWLARSPCRVPLGHSNAGYA